MRLSSLTRRPRPPDVALAIVGCGAVTQGLHLPALRALGVVPRILVDVNEQHARELAEEYGVERVGREPADAAAVAEAAVVAVPSGLHREVAGDLLERGLDVLVEKPLARSVDDCDVLIDTAREHGRLLAVGLMRRYLAANRWLHRLVTEGTLGQIQRLDIREGYRFDWPVTSFGFFHPDNGGVLRDLGSHTLDLVLWHFGPMADVRYRDNAHGGVETDCILEFTTAEGVPGVLELSRGRTLRNSFVVEAERARVEIHHFGEFVHVEPANGTRLPRDLRRPPRGDQRLLDLFVAEHADWLGAVRDRHQPLVAVDDARRAVEIMERCARVRQSWSLPWSEVA